MAGRFFPQEDRGLENKIHWFCALIVAGLVLLLLRAWNLQVVNEAYYLNLSENNRLRVVETPPPRGRIYDRNGALLVNNIPSFNLYLVRGDMPDQEAVVNRLALYSKIEADQIIEKLKKEKGDAYRPMKIKEDLSLWEVAQIEGHGLDLPGVKIEAEFKRHAVSGMLGAHLLGYVSEVTQKQLASEKYKDTKAGTIVGQYGIEQSYDAMLQGVPGEKRIEVDVLGHERQVIRERLPQRGDDIFLSLDLKVQKTAEAALATRPGAIVALDPRNGEVLAMVSHPAFDPNILSKGASSEVWAALLEDKKRPLTNRVIQGQYPPGSTFKIVVAAAILETQTASPAREVECRGFTRFGNRKFRDWKVGGHGTVNLHRSLVESCDIYYYEMGHELGVDAIAAASFSFGLGALTGIDLPFEKPGLIPTKAWKLKALKEQWYPGETLSVAIGQGFVSTTPLQLATMVGAVASNGVWHTPHLLIKRRDYKTGLISEIDPQQGRRIPVSNAALRVIKGGLAGVVSEKKGTAMKSRSDLVSIAGKTGTAQVVARPEKETDILPEAFQDHAWFVAFAPVDNPEIAVAVLVENGGHGGAAAAPLATRVIESYFLEQEGPPPLAKNENAPALRLESEGAGA